MEVPSHASSDAIERVIREHGAAIDRVAWGYADNAHDRDDLMQEVLVALWRALPRFRGESSERAFVLRIAHNRGISFSIGRRRHQAEPEQEQFPDPAPLAETQIIQEQQHDRMLRGIRQLPEAQRQAVMLRLEGLSQREIAELQNTTETNVGVRLSRARKALRVILAEEDR